MDIDRADVVVIGGGITGLASAYFISKRGKDVILVDKGIPGWEGSGRNGGWVIGFSAEFRAPDEYKRLPMSLEALRLWQTLDEELGAPTEFVGEGSLTIALTEDDILLIEDAIEYGQEWNIEARRLDLKEMQELLPGVSDRALGGLFLPTVGHANPHLTCQAWVWAIKRIGGRIYQDTTVTGIGVGNGQVTHVETTAGNIITDKIVNAAGPWVNDIAGMTDQYLPVDSYLIQMLCTLPVPPLTRCAFGGNGLYCRQAATGQLHFGGGPHGDTDLQKTSEKPTHALGIRGTSKRFIEMVPTMSEVPVLRSWAGFLDFTPDHLPILDKLDYPEGMYVIVGCGLGFSHSPGIGKAMSELVVDGRCSFDISGLSAHRFAGATDFDTAAIISGGKKRHRDAGN